MVTINEIAMHTGLNLSTVRMRIISQGCEPIGKRGKKNLYSYSATRKVTHPVSKPRPMKLTPTQKKIHSDKSDYAQIVFAYISTGEKRPSVLAAELSLNIYKVKEVLKDYLSRQEKERFEIYPSKMNDAD